jgi:hypothetical protein
MFFIDFAFCHDKKRKTKGCLLFNSLNLWISDSPECQKNIHTIPDFHSPIKR